MSFKYSWQDDPETDKIYEETLYFPAMYFLTNSDKDVAQFMFKPFKLKYIDKNGELSNDPIHPTMLFYRTDDNKLQMMIGSFGPQDTQSYLKYFEITAISRRASLLTGLCVGDKGNKADTALTVNILGSKCYNPEYWQVMNLICNKVTNSSNVISQSHFNENLDESTHFYKPHIMGYLINNCMSRECMQTGLAVPSEYTVNPGDFNALRFYLEYDNGDLVELCSPMTIILTLTPLT